jgi:acetoin utilization protein AcuB
MIVRNWMQENPITIPATMRVSEARQILTENQLHALPVVEAGRLRGLLTRANLLRTGHFVSRTQDPDEFNYFVTRLRVRDIMVRNPQTVQASDTMEHCLRRGQALGVAQFPVLDGDQVVGIISANEVFQIAAHCLGAWEQGSSLTLAPMRLGPGVIGRIADVAEAAGAVLHALYPVSARHDAVGEGGDPRRRVVVRFHAGDIDDIEAAFEAAGFAVIDRSEASRPALGAAASFAIRSVA